MTRVARCPPVVEQRCHVDRLACDLRDRPRRTPRADERAIHASCLSGVDEAWGVRQELETARAHGLKVLGAGESLD